MFFKHDPKTGITFLDHALEPIIDAGARGAKPVDIMFERRVVVGQAAHCAVMLPLALLQSNSASAPKTSAPDCQLNPAWPPPTAPNTAVSVVANGTPPRAETAGGVVGKAVALLRFAEHPGRQLRLIMFGVEESHGISSGGNASEHAVCCATADRCDYTAPFLTDFWKRRG